MASSEIQVQPLRLQMEDSFLKTEPIVDDVPGVAHSPGLVDSFPCWGDAAYRDFYEVIIANLTFDTSREMLLQCVPSADEKYPFDIVPASEKTTKAVLRFGPFYSSALRNFHAAKDVFGEQVELLRIRTYPPSLELSELSPELSEKELQKLFPTATSIDIKAKPGLAVITLPSFEKAKISFIRAKHQISRELNCRIVQLPERVEETTLLP